MEPEKEEKFKEIAFYTKTIKEVYDGIVSQTVRDPSKFIFSPTITMEAVNRYLVDKNLIEDRHEKLRGSDAFKIAGYLTYWIAKLKPVQILEPEPNKQEILINEYLAISFAVSYFYAIKNIKLLPSDLFDNLKYLLRYRTLTVRIMPLIYESYVKGFWKGADRAGEEFVKAQKAALK